MIIWKTIESMIIIMKTMESNYMKDSGIYDYMKGYGIYDYMKDYRIYDYNYEDYGI